MKDLHRRVPVDRTAARVVQPGEAYVPAVKLGTYDVRDIPPGVRPVPVNGVDLTGLACGTLTVIGLAAALKGRWVCRCACGRYVVRTAKALRNPENVAQDACPYCLHVRRLRRHSTFQQTGSWPEVAR